MRRNWFLLALALALPAAVPAQTPATRPAADLIVQGRANVEIPATIATVRISVKTGGRSPAEASERNAVAATRVRRGLLALGLPEDSVITRRVAAGQNVDYESKDTSYLADNAVTVITRRLELLPRIIDTALVLGATDVSDLSFAADSVETVYLIALADAVSNGKRRAEAIAAASGGRLGRLISTTTIESSGMPYRILESPNSISMLTTGSRGPRTPISIQAPPISVSAFVSMRWELQPTP